MRPPKAGSPEFGQGLPQGSPTFHTLCIYTMGVVAPQVVQINCSKQTASYIHLASLPPHLRRPQNSSHFLSARNATVRGMVPEIKKKLI